MTARCSLRNYLKTFGKEEQAQKSHFPYTLVTGVESLDIRLPVSYDSFVDIMTNNRNALDEDYYQFQQSILSDGLSKSEARKKLGFEKDPVPGLEVYKQLLIEWKDADLQTLRDLMKYYLK